MAYKVLGDVLGRTGRSADALAPLAEAQTRFQALADQGDNSAARMASVTLTEQGDCLAALGRLDAAAAKYEEGIQRSERLDDRRGVAVKKGQLGTLRMYQQRYADALAAHEAARHIFQELGEPATVAGAWHQIGVVHRQAENWAEAERAYRESLALEVQRGDKAGQASSLGELGNLYKATGRLEEAVTFYRQAADLYRSVGDVALEGRVRSNIADTLRQLGRLAEARREIERAIECDRPFGHAAEPWKTFGILQDIERAEGNAEAATLAWRQARQAYLSYRRDGGYAQTNHDQVCNQVLQAILQEDFHSGRTLVQRLKEAGWTPKFVAALDSILDGVRSTSLADDQSLNFTHAAELLLLLERLALTPPPISVKISKKGL